MTYICYALFASDDFMEIGYVGATKGPLKRRLADHLIKINPRYCKPKRVWITSVSKRGAKVMIRALSEHLMPEEAAKAEQQWIKFWSQYCNLTNASSTPYRQP